MRAALLVDEGKRHDIVIAGAGAPETLEKLNVGDGSVEPAAIGFVGRIDDLRRAIVVIRPSGVAQRGFDGNLMRGPPDLSAADLGMEQFEAERGPPERNPKREELFAEQPVQLPGRSRFARGGRNVDRPTCKVADQG